jgi:hypothetical protein
VMVPGGFMNFPGQSVAFPRPGRFLVPGLGKGKGTD